MNSFSSKRKRMDVQCLAPEAASSIYERPGMGFLTQSFTSGTHSEVEHPINRFFPSTAVLHGNGTLTHTVDRVALNGANQVLSNEQVQQFINSTVLPRQRIITKPWSASNVGFLSHSQPDSRPTQQDSQAFGTQRRVSMGRVATQSNVAPQIKGHKSVQKIATRNDIDPRQQTQLSAITTMFYGQSQQSVQKADLGRLYSGINSGQNGQIRQYATIAPDQICPQNKKSTNKRRIKCISKDSEVPQGSNTAPKVGEGFDSNQQSSGGLTSKHHVTAGNNLQNSPTNQPEPWSLLPQPVHMYVKPMEAQTNQTLSKLLAGREAEKNGYHQVAKRKIDTAQSDGTGRKRKKMKGQSQSHDGEELSTEQAGGKKTVKRIVIPPKVRQNPVSYPPYVSRIMKILARGQQNQTDISDNAKNPNEKLTQQRSDELGTESVSKEIKREAITPRNEDNKNFSKDLSCDAILDTDNFFGPEMFVTSGDQCYASLFP